jgi:hypothetical protein
LRIAWVVTHIWRNHTLYRAFKNNTDWPASTGTNDFAQSSTALSADGHSVVDCEYVDMAALAVSALFWSRARRIARARFRLERMTRFLSRAIERVYGVISAVDPPPKPKPVIY